MPNAQPFNRGWCHKDQSWVGDILKPILPNAKSCLVFVVWMKGLDTEALQSKADASHCASLPFFPPSDRAHPFLTDSCHHVGLAAEEPLLILWKEKERGLKDCPGLLSLEAGCWEP